MDANTKDVLMALIALISAIVTPLVVVYVARQQANKMNTIKDKVDEYHKEVNGKMGQLLETTKDLATANEKARAKEEKK
jgi:hypothetical protein